MNQEKIGKFIKEIREKNHLTQKQFADRYNVTYQAVSKWENGINMPDTLLIKQISKDFNVSLEELFDGEYKNKKNKKIFIIGIFLAIALIFIFIILILLNRNNDFQFKTLSTHCSNFKISGNVAYSQNKSSIYITNIKYCGGSDDEEYKLIECILYEANNNIEKRISSYKYEEKENIKLEDFLQQVTFSIDDYSRVCKEYSKDSLYLLINATNKDNKVISYKIPLELNDKCSN